MRSLATLRRDALVGEFAYLLIGRGGSFVMSVTLTGLGPDDDPWYFTALREEFGEFRVFDPPIEVL